MIEELKDEIKSVKKHWNMIKKTEYCNEILEVEGELRWEFTESTFVDVSLRDYLIYINKPQEEMTWMRVGFINTYCNWDCTSYGEIINRIDAENLFDDDYEKKIPPILEGFVKGSNEIYERKGKRVFYSLDVLNLYKNLTQCFLECDGGAVKATEVKRALTYIEMMEKYIKEELDSDIYELYDGKNERINLGNIEVDNKEHGMKKTQRGDKLIDELTNETITTIDKLIEKDEKLEKAKEQYQDDVIIKYKDEEEEEDEEDEEDVEDVNLGGFKVKINLTAFQNAVQDALDDNDKDEEDDKEDIDNNTYKNESLEKLQQELKKMIGLDEVKKNINSIINLVEVRKLRKNQGLDDTPLSLHMVFTGNPGTGKTTVARLLAKIYAKLGVLSKGSFIEVDRGGLVGGYVGQTALKVKDVVKKSLGGILFIDEAYSLTDGKDDGDYGYEAVDTLLKEMEDNREDFIVIVAGYTDRMQGFLNSNPGLRSRFNKFIEFADYSENELYEIFINIAMKNSYQLEDKSKEFLSKYISDIYKNKGDNFGNGRVMRNLFEKIVMAQTDRIVRDKLTSKDDLIKLKVEDFLEATQSYYEK